MKGGTKAHNDNDKNSYAVRIQKNTIQEKRIRAEQKKRKFNRKLHFNWFIVRKIRF